MAKLAVNTNWKGLKVTIYLITNSLSVLLMMTVNLSKQCPIITITLLLAGCFKFIVILGHAPLNYLFL